AVCLAADGGGGQFAPAVAGKAVVDGIPLAGRAPRDGPCQAVVSVFPRYGCTFPAVSVILTTRPTRSVRVVTVLSWPILNNFKKTPSNMILEGVFNKNK
ncbi:hypothetical protein, partial [Akkermansia muciniphila]|uniref:hypothetical protein n=1 Tax=Akkermansia muciniphila TaxID=239935 RepID=UPI001CA4BDB7